MRFFKSFSLLHRRAKSDSAVLQVVPKTHAQTRPFSLSVEQPDEPVLINRNGVFDTFVPFNTPSPFTPVPVMSTHASADTHHALNDRIRALSSENAKLISNSTSAVLNKRILALESEIAQLKGTELRIEILELERSHLNSTIQILLTTTTELSEDATKARCDLHDALRQGAYLRQQAKEDGDEIQQLREKLVQCSRFIGLMVDIGLHEAVLMHACDALRHGEGADEALIVSIKKAAAKPGSPWSKIIPAITGPRTSDEYLSAINMTLKLRRELKDCEKVAKFWKRSAKEDSEKHLDTVTPSVSNISSIHEVLSEERQNAVDDLLVQLRSGTYPSRRKNAAITEYEAPEPAIASFDDTTLYQDVEVQASTSTPSVDESTVTTCSSVSTFRNSSSTIRSPYVPNLPPLASESFKEELVATQSYKHISVLNSKPHSRVVLGNVDLNRSISRTSLPASDSTMSWSSRRSAKALGKRRAMVVTQSIESIKATYAPSYRESSLEVPIVPVPATDEFVDALSASLLAIKDGRRHKSDLLRVSVCSTPFDNSAFSCLIDNETPNTATPRAPLRSLHSIMEDCEGLETNTKMSVLQSSLRKINEERQICNLSSSKPLEEIGTSEGDDYVNHSASRLDTIRTACHNHDEHDLSSEDCSTILTDPDFAIVESSTASTTAPTSPIKPATAAAVAIDRIVVTPPPNTNTTSPVKGSRLPVMRHLRRLSPKFIPVVSLAWPHAKIVTTTPLVIKKDAKAGAPPPPLAINPTPVYAPCHSRLPTFAKAGAGATARGRISNSGKMAVRRLSRIVS